MALGIEAGKGTQGSGAVAIGFLAGQVSQGVNAVAIGTNAGQISQGSGSIAIGYLAGSQQGTNSIVISAKGTVVTGATADASYMAPLRNVTQTTVIGYDTTTNELTYYPTPSGGSGSIVPTGSEWGQGLNWNSNTNTWQITGAGPLAFGNNAGQTNQGTGAVALGIEAGRGTQGSGAIAIGFQVGFASQGQNAIAIGVNTSQTNQGSGAIAIGYLAGSQQASNSVVISALGTVVTGAVSNASYLAPLRNITQTTVIGYDTTTNELTYYPTPSGGSGSSVPTGSEWGQGLNWNNNTNTWQITGAGPLAFGNYAGQSGQGTAAVALGVGTGSGYQGTEAVAIGFQAGGSTQGAYAVAIGSNAGQTEQGSYSVAIGYLAGSQQAQNSVVISALGTVVTGGTANATFIAPIRSVSQNNVLGYDTNTNELTYYVPLSGSVPTGSVWGQGLNWNDTLNSWQITGDGPLAFGNNAGQSGQGTAAIALGIEAGRGTQGSGAVAIGFFAGHTSQNDNAIAIGTNSGQIDQMSGSISIGLNAGRYSQGTMSVAVGLLAGATSQQQHAVALGYFSGGLNQGTASTAVGHASGRDAQGENAVAVGHQSAQFTQNNGAVAIGYNSGRYAQGTFAVGIGIFSGETQQGLHGVALGYLAGSLNQGTASTAVGHASGRDVQGENAVAVGHQAAQFTQGSGAIAIGFSAGRYSQGTNAIAIGEDAGRTNQGSASIAIGAQAGMTNQGDNSIAIGYLAGSQQAANSIVISATGTVVTGATASGTYIAPLRNITQTTVIGYNTTSNELTYYPTPSGGGGGGTALTMRNFTQAYTSNATAYQFKAVNFDGTGSVNGGTALNDWGVTFGTPSSFSVPTTGFYNYSLWLWFAPPSANNMCAAVRVNSTNVIKSQFTNVSNVTVGEPIHTSGSIYLTAGNTIEFGALVGGTSVNMNISTTNACYANILRIF